MACAGPDKRGTAKALWERLQPRQAPQMNVTPVAAEASYSAVAVI